MRKIGKTYHMKTLLLLTSALTLVGGIAAAGGIDRAQPSYSVLFEEGNYAQFSFSSQDPTVTGTHGSGITAAGITTETGNMAGNESQFNFAIKTEITDRLSFGFFMGNAYGARADYQEGLYSTLSMGQLTAITGGSVAGVTGDTNLRAEWKSTAYEAILKYNVTDQASVYGGLRAITSTAEIGIPVQLVAASAANNGVAFAADYAAQGSQETDFGYVLGVAYEIPDIAARVAITYRSEIEHDFDVEETASLLLGGTTEIPIGFGTSETSTKVTMPQSWTIDFQTGIAQDTLLFGSVKWTEWSVWEVRTEEYETLTGGEITGFSNDVWTYSLGVGRRLNDNFSVFAALGYEEAQGGEPSRLAPTDGYRSVSLGGAYTFDTGLSVRAGVQRLWVGDAEISDGALGTTEFEDNAVTAFGMSVGFKF